MSASRDTDPPGKPSSETRAPGKLTLLGGISLVSFQRLLVKLRLRRRADGWRRGASLVLRGEPAMFYLSAFGLDAGGGEGMAPATLHEMQERIGSKLKQFLEA